MGVGPLGGGGSGEQCEIGVEMAAKSCAMLKRYEFLGGNPSKCAPYARDHRSKLRRCEPRRQASKWFKGAPTERVFGDKQRVVVKVMVT